MNYGHVEFAASQDSAQETRLPELGSYASDTHIQYSEVMLRWHGGAY